MYDHKLKEIKKFHKEVFGRKVCMKRKNTVSLHTLSPDGGIGRRAGLKHQWSNPSRFEPGSGYIKRVKLLTNKHLTLFLFNILTKRKKKKVKRLIFIKYLIGLINKNGVSWFT